MISVNQGIGTSVQEKLQKGGTHDVSCQRGWHQGGHHVMGIFAKYS